MPDDVWAPPMMPVICKLSRSPAGIGTGTGEENEAPTGAMIHPKHTEKKRQN